LPCPYPPGSCHESESRATQYCLEFPE
jgi:hypothetical protein